MRANGMYAQSGGGAGSGPVSRFATGQQSLGQVGAMLRFEDKLPRLPVPTLRETCDKYLTSLRPLLSESEFQKSSQAVNEFLKPGGVGEELQKRLVARAAEPNRANWLEEWWNDLAYFGYRDPVVVYVSYFFAFNDDKSRKTPAARAASITTAALEFRKLVVTQQLEPEYAKKEPMSMDSYKWMFNACRYPKKPSDYEATFDPNSNNHIAVMRKNKFYVFDLVRDGKQLSTAEIELQFKRIIENAGSSKAPAVGALTADNRNIWTDNRDKLIKADPKNAELLKKIESAVFVVCLDDSSPATRDEVSHACWVGDGRNRFYDKSLQFVVFDNGKAGFLGEHSSMDGTPTSRMNDYILTQLSLNKVDHGSANASSSLPQPHELKFKLNNDLNKAIDSAGKAFDDLVGKHELRTLAYTAYGKNSIKKFKLSPDAYVQMVIQLAYYKMNGKPCATYESAQTRKFRNGRTEVCRTLSSDSLAWTQAMEDNSTPAEKKVELLKKAIDSHVRYMADAVEGRGVDRHLLGLRMSIRPNEPKPSIFADPAYSRSSHWQLSTSQLSSEHFFGYGWGEVVPDGFGVAYMVKERSLHFNVVSMKLGSHRLVHYLSEAADDMRDILEKVQGPDLKAKL